MNPPDKKIHHPRAAFYYPDFRYFLGARFLTLCAHQMLIVAVSQNVYERTHSPLHLGYIGLCFFLPKFGLTLFAGHIADRFDRWGVILVCRVVQFITVIGIIFFFARETSSLWILYSLLVIKGTANTFDGPASQSFVPELVSPSHFNNAVAWNSTIFQLAFITGPALGGWLYAVGSSVVYIFYIIAAVRLVSIMLVCLVRTRTGRLEKSEFSLKTLMAGIHYVFKKHIILGIISMDLFAVLLGGAVALLPIYANDILKVGPSGLGILRAAPAVGAAVMALCMAHMPPIKKAGVAMLWSVTIFGIATVFFGLSRTFLFSILCLVILGAADMVSVIIRGVVVQVQTPPEMRGRVSAVNLIFIGASNELGEFESGLTASLFGVVPAVVIGGLGTLAVAGLWAIKFPEIRKYGELG